MSKPRFTPAYPAELRERGVRLFRENRGDYASDTAAYKAIAPKLGCSPDSLRVWCQQAERDAGHRGGLTSAEKDRIKELEREVRELRTANEILKKGEPLARHWSERQWRTHISLRRSSTAHSANDRVHRRSPLCPWCRADLPGSGDRTIDVSCLQGCGARSRLGLGSGPAGSAGHGRHQAGLRWQSGTLRGAQGLAPVAPRGARHCPLHGGDADEGDGITRRCPRQESHHDQPVRHCA